MTSGRAPTLKSVRCGFSGSSKTKALPLLTFLCKFTLFWGFVTDSPVEMSSAKVGKSTWDIHKSLLISPLTLVGNGYSQDGIEWEVTIRGGYLHQRMNPGHACYGTRYIQGHLRAFFESRREDTILYFFIFLLFFCIFC